MAGVSFQNARLTVSLPTKDYELSKAFYEALGFRKLHDYGEAVVFDCGAARFMLERYYATDWAENITMHLEVDDFDAWWRHVQDLDLPARFGTREPTGPPLNFQIVCVQDPANVMWLITPRR